ncbi:MAG: T9SS type A sorting domain-containing protein, partial [Flavobacteriales bacterium]|nr:T9SS type A sorting domain-containing protein [Flavobacteriales bacterium]
EAMTASSKKINVSNFRNGVYFVIIDSENAKPVTRRIIVRH